MMEPMIFEGSITACVMEPSKIEGSRTACVMEPSKIESSVTACVMEPSKDGTLENRGFHHGVRDGSLEYRGFHHPACPHGWSVVCLCLCVSVSLCPCVCVRLRLSNTLLSLYLLSLSCLLSLPLPRSGGGCHRGFWSCAMSACRQRTASCIVIGCKTARRELTGWCGVGVLQLAEGATSVRRHCTIRAMSVRRRRNVRAMSVRRHRTIHHHYRHSPSSLRDSSKIQFGFFACRCSPLSHSWRPLRPSLHRAIAPAQVES